MIRGKEVFTALLTKELDGHKKLLDDALPRVSAAVKEKKLSPEAHECFEKSRKMLDAAYRELKDEDFEKTLRFMVHAVSNYYLMLGDKGVLRHG
jgi:DNA-binding MurR/RpiR family transcriptional regulator